MQRLRTRQTVAMVCQIRCMSTQELGAIVLRVLGMRSNTSCVYLTETLTLQPVRAAAQLRAAEAAVHLKTPMAMRLWPLTAAHQSALRSDQWLSPRLCATCTSKSVQHKQYRSQLQLRRDTSYPLCTQVQATAQQ